MRDEPEPTERHTVVTDDTQSHPVPPPGPPPDAVPPRLAADIVPWLALLGVLAIAGLLVWLFVFRSTAHGRIVPAVVGLQQQRAIARLTHDGFGVRAIVGPAGKPRGIVASQTPGGGSRLDKGQIVVIHVSNGIKPQPASTATTSTATATTHATNTTPLPSAAVPNVVGQTAPAGAGQVEAAGFVAETDPVSAAGTPGSVVQESPAGGTSAPGGSVVKLAVAVGSSRPQTHVPNVVGQKAAAARAALLGSKLTVRTVFHKGPAKEIGVVVGETPAAGSAEPAYTQVTITVGS
jgi:eukaryotic-like serine/threonine-protein kinase